MCVCVRGSGDWTTETNEEEEKHAGNVAEKGDDGNAGQSERGKEDTDGYEIGHKSEEMREGGA